MRFTLVVLLQKKLNRQQDRRRMKALPLACFDGIQAGPTSWSKKAIPLLFPLAPGHPLHFAILLQDRQSGLGAGKVDRPFLAALIGVVDA